MPDIQIDWGELLESIGIMALKFLVVYIAFILVKKFGNRIIESTFDRYIQKNSMSAGRGKTLKGLTQNVFTYVLFFIFIVTVLQTVFNIQATPILAGAGVVGLAVGFGAQGLVSDVVTGFFMLLEKQVDVGDYITVGAFSGIVEEVGLRTTQIRGFDGTLHYVPNRDITSLSNHSRGNMRALVDISISYNDDIDRAIQVLQETCDRIARENENIVEGPNVLGVQTLGASEVVIRIIGKCKNGEQFAVERNIKKALKEALDANGIEIPFPHQVLIQRNEGQSGVERG
ncbi:small-conductance mechanosensitive channel protein MscT [Bacillus carboniphilus]|uniref:Small-conductance mechanosensitive channel protein MscT n=1 Tax=Bacillus carboniphilus TaxID=86663 RepID=A0ABP3FUY3_9BACI